MGTGTWMFRVSGLGIEVWSLKIRFGVWGLVWCCFLQDGCLPSVSGSDSTYDFQLTWWWWGLGHNDFASPVVCSRGAYEWYRKSLNIENRVTDDGTNRKQCYKGRYHQSFVGILRDLEKMKKLLLTIAIRSFQIIVKELMLKSRANKIVLGVLGSKHRFGLKISGFSLDWSLQRLCFGRFGLTISAWLNCALSPWTTFGTQLPVSMRYAYVVWRLGERGCQLK